MCAQKVIRLDLQFYILVSPAVFSIRKTTFLYLQYEF